MNRTRLEIVRDILQIASGTGDFGSRKTHIMHGANLSYRLLTRYLDTVLNSGLATCEDGSYLITDKGQQFLQVYERYEREKAEMWHDRLNLEELLKGEKE